MDLYVEPAMAIATAASIRFDVPLSERLLDLRCRRVREQRRTPSAAWIIEIVTFTAMLWLGCRVTVATGREGRLEMMSDHSGGVARSSPARPIRTERP